MPFLCTFLSFQFALLYGGSAIVAQVESAAKDLVHVQMHALIYIYRYRMDAQHVICAGQVRHATRQTDATCHKSAEFRYMAHSNSGL